MTATTTEPQELVAQQFLERKGLTGLKPVEVDKLEGQPCWYYIYELDEGELELEVTWSEREGWRAITSTFRLWDD